MQILKPFFPITVSHTSQHVVTATLFGVAAVNQEKKTSAFSIYFDYNIVLRTAFY